MKRYSDEEYERMGVAWRIAAKQNNLIRFNAIEFVRSLKREGYIKDYACVPDSDLPTATAKFDPDKGMIFYRQSTWDAAQEGDPRAKWTLVHEGCHAILKHQDVRYRSNVIVRNNGAAVGRDETEAHRLTACILAPFEKANFTPETTAEDISVRFGLSTKAAETRLEEFRRLYRHRHGNKRELPPGIVDFLLEQRRKGMRITSIPDEEQLLLPKPQMRYEGDPCPCCGALTLVRNGLARTCSICGARTGDD